MRVIWVFGAALGAAAGGATATVLPLAQISQTMRGLGVDLSGVTVADLDPLRAAYDLVNGKVQAGVTPDELGFHPSPVTLTWPDAKAWPGAGFSLDPGMRNGWARTAEQQTRDFNNRMEDMRNYARSPAGWHGPPPH